MKTSWMKRLAVAGILSLGLTAMSAPLAAGPRFSVGIGIGTPGYYAPAPVVAYRLPYPGPGYTWVDGFYDPYGVWIAGYWAPPVVRGYGFREHGFREHGFRGYGYGFAPGFRGGHERGFVGRGREFRGRR